MIRAAERPVETTRKAGPIVRTCCVCGSFDAARGVGPPAAPTEMWFCGVTVSDCLPTRFFTGREAALVESLRGRAA